MFGSPGVTVSLRRMVCHPTADVAREMLVESVRKHEPSLNSKEVHWAETLQCAAHSRLDLILKGLLTGWD